MSRLRPKELRTQGDEELNKKLSELRAELAKLRSSSARGVLRKESGKVKVARRDIARLLTVLNEKKVEAGRSEGT